MSQKHGGRGMERTLERRAWMLAAARKPELLASVRFTQTW